MSVISLHLVAKKNSDSYFTRLVHFRISSATPALIGNSGALSWEKRYKTDNFGKRQYVWTETEEIQPLLNTEWDPTRKYVARKDRAEWLPVGLIDKC